MENTGDMAHISRSLCQAVDCDSLMMIMTCYLRNALDSLSDINLIKLLHLHHLSKFVLVVIYCRGNVGKNIKFGEIYQYFSLFRFPSLCFLFYSRDRLLVVKQSSTISTKRDLTSTHSFIWPKWPRLGLSLVLFALLFPSIIFLRTLSWRIRCQNILPLLFSISFQKALFIGP